MNINKSNASLKNKIRVFMIGMSTDKGGVESYIQNLCKELDTKKYEIVYHWPEIILDGKTWILPKNRHNYISYSAFWKQFYKENHFDVIYLNTCDIVSIDHLKIAKAAGVPIRIIHSHSTGNQQSLNNKMSLFHQICEIKNRREIGKIATHLFSCSSISGKWMYGRWPFKIIQNGINLKIYEISKECREHIRRIYGFQNEKIIGIIGRIDPVKNIFFSLKIFEHLFKMEQTIKVVIIGDGEQRLEAEEYVNNNNMADRIMFVGAVDNVHEWMSTIDCILMPSLFEGLPFVLVEAQAAGLPCIVSTAVSEEANITGLVQYIDIDDNLDIWAQELIKACQKDRVDVKDKLIDAGYSIEETANEVSGIIESSLCEF